MRPYLRHKKGFTIIEIMLVIAIIAVITLISVSVYQKRSDSYKVTQTVEQIEKIGQAAAAYYIANNSVWPAASGPTQTIPTDFINYFSLSLVQGQALNPWGFPYTIDGSQSNSKIKFLISTQVISPAIAQRVAGKLPFGSSNGNYVKFYVTVPGQKIILPQQNYIIKGVGYTNYMNDGSCQTFSVTCPDNWSAGITGGIERLNANDASQDNAPANGSVLISSVDMNSATQTDPTQSCTQGSDSHTCNICARATTSIWHCKNIFNPLTCSHSPTNYGEVRFMYILFCQNPQFQP